MGVADGASVAPVDLAAAKAHLRIDAEDTAEDGLIAGLVAAAKLAIEGKIFRRVYATSAPLDLDPEGMVVNAVINQAVLLIVGHLFANREAVAAGARVEVPMGVGWLLEPHVNYAGGA